jgi:hypothetical protein
LRPALAMSLKRQRRRKAKIPVANSFCDNRSRGEDFFKN